MDSQTMICRLSLLPIAQPAVRICILLCSTNLESSGRKCCRGKRRRQRDEEVLYTRKGQKQSRGYKKTKQKTKNENKTRNKNKTKHVYSGYRSQTNGKVVNWINTTRKSSKHLRATYVQSSVGGGDHGIYSWWDLIRWKQLFSGSVCRAQVFAGFFWSW